MRRLQAPTLIALACALALPLQPAAANGGHADEAAAKTAPKATAKPAAKEAAKEVAKEAARPEAGADAMDQLRQKLAERLGAVKAPDPKNPYMVRVANKAGAEHGAANVGAMSQAAPRAAAPKAAVPALQPGHGHDAHWSYEGDSGPQAWGRMKPEFDKCSTGTRQSPIDIRSGIQVQLPAIQFDYRATGFSVIDNGHTVQVNLPSGNAITVLGRRYDLVQFHFHRPSEERINGKQFDMVAHLVHKDPEGKLAVVAVLLERGSAQPLIQAVWNALPLEKGEDVPAPVAIDLNQLLPEDKRYYTYMGSLTTPPCSEGVLWMVMKQPVQLSNDQLGIFTRLYPMNARPIQQASGRLIKESD